MLFGNFTGAFEHRKNCTLPHIIREGYVTFDGTPIIVFPKDPAKIVLGRNYELDVKLTRRATYTIDDTVYRVAHGRVLGDVDGVEADWVEQITHNTAPPKATLEDSLPPGVREKLLALRGESA
jgi:hypothetical protein